MIYKCTFFFTSGVTGWSESYYCTAGNPTNALILARSLANKRIALCGIPVDLPDIRVSDVSIRGDAVLDGQPGFTTSSSSKTLIQTKTGGDDGEPDVSWTSAVFTMSKGGISLGRVFARGLPDGFFSAPRAFTPSHGWMLAFKRFAAEFGLPANGWGVLRKPKSTPENTFKILTANATPGENLIIKTDAGFTVPVKSLVSIRGLKSDKGSFSGNVVVESVAGNIYHVLKQFTNQPVTFTPNSGTVQLATPQFVGELLLTYSTVSTSRRTGRPFGSQAGRRKTSEKLT